MLLVEQLLLTNQATSTPHNLLFGWGNGNFGELDNGQSLMNPKKIDTSSWTSVSAGLDHVTAIKSTGALFTWGYNSKSQLGNGSVYNSSSPIQIGTSSWTSISSGNQFSIAIRNDGGIFGWGKNNLSQTGVNYTSPVQVGSTSWLAIAQGQTTSLAIDSTNKLFSFPSNSLTGSPTPIGTSTWSAVAITKSTVQTYMALRSDGILFCWGTNTLGTIGDNTTIDKTSPVQIGSSTWTTIATTYDSCAAIRSDGSLFTWGSNNNGQLGVASFAILSKSSPTQVGTSSWIAITGGGSIGGANPGGFMMALRLDSGLFTWGTDTSGQLGDGTKTDRNSPAQVGTSSWSSIAAGAHVSAAIRTDGGLFTWGSGVLGALGNGSVTSRSSPAQVGTSSWNVVNCMGFTSAGGGMMTAIRTDGALFGWGTNYNGNLGINSVASVVASRSSPVQIGTSSWSAIWSGSKAMLGTMSNLLFSAGFTMSVIGSPIQLGTSSWSAVSAGYQHSAAIRTDGGLFTWGSNVNGGMGDNTSVKKFSPVQIGTSSWTFVGPLGKYTSGAIKTTGALFTWGRNTGGSMGDNTLVDKSSPVQIGTSSWTFVGFSKLTESSFGIRLDGGLFSWGNNNVGQLGDNSITTRSSPVQIGTSSWTTVSYNGCYSIGVDSTNRVFSIGGNVTYLGSHSSPVQVNSGFTTAFLIGNATGNGGAYIGMSGPSIFTWNMNSPQHNLFTNETTRSQYTSSSPVQIGTTSWTKISAGRDHVLAIDSNNKLWTWGRNSSKTVVIGDGTTISKSSPVQIGTSSWTAISVGTAYEGSGIFSDSNLAIRSDGALFSWGVNSFGQLGDGTQTNQSSPIQIGTSSWTSISTHENISLAIRSDGSLFAWGLNDYGQLGDGTQINKSSPIQIGTSSWTSISTNFKHSMAIRNGGSLFSWGFNNAGQLGDGTQINQSSPVQIGTSSWTTVSSGKYSSHAIRLDKALFAWGFNNVGQLGDNTLIDKSSPVQIGTSSWTLIRSCNENYVSVGIKNDGSLFAWGLNSTGLIGNNTKTQTSSPVQVGTSSWVAVSVGKGIITAIKF